MVIAAKIGGRRKHLEDDRQAMSLEEWAEPYVRAWTAMPGAFITISERGGNWMVLLGVHNAKMTGAIVQKLWGASSGPFSRNLAAQARDEILDWFRKVLPQNADPMVETTLRTLQMAEPCNFEFDEPRVEPIVVNREHVQLKNADGFASKSGYGPSELAAASSKWTVAISALQVLTLILVAIMVWEPTHFPTHGQTETDTETRRLQLGSALASYQLVQQLDQGMTELELEQIEEQINFLLSSCDNKGASIRPKELCAPETLKQMHASLEAIERERKARGQRNNNGKQIDQLLEQWSKEAEKKLIELSPAK